jgi:aquaporin Z
MKKYVAEFIGTAVLVLVGCGAAVIAGNQLWLIGIALAFWLAVMGMAYTIGSISGCHINPAITLAFFMRGDISGRDASWYMVAQFAGAALGALLLSLIVPATVTNLAANMMTSGVPPLAGLMAEALLTAIFILVIFGATHKDSSGNLAWLVIGLTLAMAIMVLGPLTNASLNPARSFGPALFSGVEALNQLWYFIVGPVLGAIIAVLTWKYLLHYKKAN